MVGESIATSAAQKKLTEVYEVTATRKRPQAFAELAGQDFVSATLAATLKNQHIAHAYLFSGPRGCGKTSTARILAKALNCQEGPTATPCGVCQSCVEITRGSNLDVIEIDGASNTSVENIRQIKDEVLFPPTSSKYKIYIIDEVHMLTTNAFNALLKTIEEPPPYVVFIFATTEIHKIPITIRSRCQQFAFRLVPIDTIKALLAGVVQEQGISADEDALLWIAKESGGSMRDAYTLFDQVAAFSDGQMQLAKIHDKLGLVGLDVMGEFFGIFASKPSEEAAAPPPSARALELLATLFERGVSAEQIVVDMADYCRCLLLLKNNITRPALLGAELSAFNADVVKALSLEHIELALGTLLQTHRNLAISIDARFEVELLVSKLARLTSFVLTSEIVKAVGSIKRKIAAGSMDSLRVLNDSKVVRSTSMAPEKKKEEIPNALKAVFSDLAAVIEDKDKQVPAPSTTNTTPSQSSHAVSSTSQAASNTIQATSTASNAASSASPGASPTIPAASPTSQANSANPAANSASPNPAESPRPVVAQDSAPAPKKPAFAMPEKFAQALTPPAATEPPKGSDGKPDVVAIVEKVFNGKRIAQNKIEESPKTEHIEETQQGDD